MGTMPDAKPDQSLHLPSLVIKNFRGIDELTIPRLGRVTLLAGKNGVGKTTVLDAVRVWAYRAAARVLSDVLINRDEFVQAIDINGEEIGTADWEALFHGRKISVDNTISIGTSGDTDTLRIRLVALDPTQQNQLLQPQLDIFSDEQVFGLEVSFRDFYGIIPASYVQVSGTPVIRRRLRPAPDSRSRSRRPSDEILCNTLGPNIPDNATIERFLNDVGLTPDEQYAIDALNLVTQGTADRVAVLGSGTRKGSASGRRVMVRFNNFDYPVPLRSLGDGAVRIFATALAFASSRGGLLLIDEAENGIHHSIQAKFWNMVLQTAQRNNVQVLATTHSWDCVKGFAEASAALEDIEGVLVRLERHEDHLRAVEYSERNLKAAAKYGIEVR